MRLKNILKIGFTFLAAGMLLTGCGEVKGTVDRSGGNIETVTPQKGDLIATFEIEGHGTIKAVLFPDIAPVGVENFQKLADSGYYNGLTIHRVYAGFMFQGGSLNGNGTGGDAMVNGGSFGIETSENARHFYGALCYANAAGQNSTQFYIVNDKQQNQFDNLISMYNEYIVEFSARAAAASSEDEKAYYEYVVAQSKATIDSINADVAAMDPKIKSLYDERGGSYFLDGDYTVFGQVYEGFDVIDSISSVEVVDNGGGEKSWPVETIVIKSVKVSNYK